MFKNLLIKKMFKSNKYVFFRKEPKYNSRIRIVSNMFRIRFKPSFIYLVNLNRMCMPVKFKTYTKKFFFNVLAKTGQCHEGFRLSIFLNLKTLPGPHMNGQNVCQYISKKCVSA